MCVWSCKCVCLPVCPCVCVNMLCSLVCGLARTHIYLSPSLCYHYTLPSNSTTATLALTRAFALSKPTTIITRVWETALAMSWLMSSRPFLFHVPSTPCNLAKVVCKLEDYICSHQIETTPFDGQKRHNLCRMSMLHCLSSVFCASSLSWFMKIARSKGVSKLTFEALNYISLLITVL